MTADIAIPTRPEWFEEIGRRFESDRSQFLLDFNVRDKVFAPGSMPHETDDTKRLLRVDEYLIDALVRSGRFELVLGYSLTTGIRLLNTSSSNNTNRLRTTINGTDELYKTVSTQVTGEPDLKLLLERPTHETLPYTREPMHAFAFLDRLLMKQFQLNNADSYGSKTIRVAVIIDYLENLAPASQAGHRDQIMLAETLSRWATSQAIRENAHLIILLTEDVNQISQTVFSSAAGTVRIRLERPNHEERTAFLQHWIGPNNDHAQAARLSSATAGFNYAELDDLIIYSEKQTGSRIPTPTLIRERKRDVISTESRGLLEVVDTETIGFEHVGGLTHIKKALQDVCLWLQTPELTHLVPKGMFFVGPPGTGKSLISQALAKESGINMVKLRDVQSMWVGESERNMSRVLDVARAFAPVIVFIDEIDQAYGQRGGGDTTGVSSRLFGKLLEFMGDNANRGRVLWVAASNRPDFVDAALISRFDRVLPFLLPDRANRQEILLLAMPKTLQMPWAAGTDLSTWGEEDLGALNELLDLTEEYSGRELELIVRRGIELAGGQTLAPINVLEAARRFEHNHDRNIYRLQTLLALQATSFKDYMPAPEALTPVDLINFILTEDGTAIDRSKIQDQIRRLRQM